MNPPNFREMAHGEIAAWVDSHEADLTAAAVPPPADQQFVLLSVCSCGCGCEPDGDWHWTEQFCQCVALKCLCVVDSPEKTGDADGA